MKVIKPSYKILNEPDWDSVIISLEKAIRTCYKSEKKIDAGTADKLIRNIISRGHESTLEHASMSVRFVCDRGVSHEMVRHRHCSFSQESTRYVSYDASKIEFIQPPWLEKVGPERYHWITALESCAMHYQDLLGLGWKPEQARSVLPNSLKTEIVVTTNIRDWRHILHLRCDKTAHPQMRELMVPLWEELCIKCPTLFDSITFNRAE